jgi:hypothetical protein
LDVAREVARVLGARVDAVHVEEAGGPPEIEIPSGESPLRVLRGDPAGALIAEAAGEDVAAIVVGLCREIAGPVPVGHVSLDVVGNVPRPVVVVPPTTAAGYALHTVLVPVVGRPPEALEEVVVLAENAELHVVVLRALDELSIPAFEDQPHYDVEAWAGEFLARWVPGAGADTEVEVRIGPPEELVGAVADEVCADLVVIGRTRAVPIADAPLVVAALRHSHVPIALLPLARSVALSA